MKKRFIALLVLGSLSALISACQNDFLEVPDHKPVEWMGFIKEMRINRPGDPETEIIKVTYDESNRVNSVFYSYYGEDSYEISYGTNTVVLKDANGNNLECSVNSDGFVTKMEDVIYSYSGRNIVYITQQSIRLQSITDENGNEVTTMGSIETIYSWKDGNLTGCIRKLNSENEDQVPSKTVNTTYSYHEAAGNPFYQKGIDPFMILSGDHDFVFGFYGDSNKNLMTGYNDNYFEISNRDGKPAITLIRVLSKHGSWVADCTLSY